MTKFREPSKKKQISRRAMLKGSAAVLGVAAATSVGGFPTLWAQDIKDIEIRMLGSAVTHQKPWEEMAVEATGLLLAADDAIPPEVAVASGVSQAKGIETKTA